MSVNIKAPGFRVLVRLKPLERVKEEKSQGGIILEVKTDSKLNREQEAVCKAYVIDVGPDAWWDVNKGEPWCKPGDCVQIARYSGVIIGGVKNEEGKELEVYRIVNDKDIQAVFPNERIEL